MRRHLAIVFIVLIVGVMIVCTLPSSTLKALAQATVIYNIAGYLDSEMPAPGTWCTGFTPVINVETGAMLICDYEGIYGAGETYKWPYELYFSSYNTVVNTYVLKNPDGVGAMFLYRSDGSLPGDNIAVYVGDGTENHHVRVAGQVHVAPITATTAPFVLETNAQNQLVSYLNADLWDGADLTDYDASADGTIDNAAALAANPADCSAGDFATTIAANGDLTCAGVKLDDLDAPSGNTSFTMANKNLVFTYVAPTGGDGAFEIEASGAFSGDLMHIHQHTGNPGAAHLVHFESEDDDVDAVWVAGTANSTVLSLDTDGDDTAEYKWCNDTPAHGEVLEYDGTNDCIVYATDDSGGAATFDISEDGTVVASGVSAFNAGSGIDVDASGNLTMDLSEIKSQVCAITWPVGSIFVTLDATDPNTTLGCGSWSAFGAGKVLVGLDSGDADFDATEEAGGAKTVASSAQTFAGDALAGHAHGVGTYAVSSHAVDPANQWDESAADSSYADHTLSGSSESVSGGTPAGTNTPGAATSVVQPYIVVRFWKRTS